MADRAATGLGGEGCSYIYDICTEKSHPAQWTSLNGKIVAVNELFQQG